MKKSVCFAGLRPALVASVIAMAPGCEIHELMRGGKARTPGSETAAMPKTRIIPGRRLLTVPGDPGASLSPDANRVAFPRTGLGIRGIEVRDLEMPSRKSVIEPEVPSSGVNWSPDGSWLASESIPGGLRVYESSKFRRVWANAKLSDPAWSGNSKHLAAFDLTSGLTQIVDTRTWRVLRSLGVCARARWSPDSRRLVAQFSSPKPPYNLFRVIETGTWASVVNVDADVNNVYSVAWSSDSKLLAFGGDFPVFAQAANAWLVDAGTGKVLHKFREYPTQVRSAAWSPSSTLIAFTHGTRASDGRTDVINIHDVKTGALDYQLQGPSTMVFDLRWDQQLPRIRAVAGNGSTLEVWEWTIPASG